MANKLTLTEYRARILAAYRLAYRRKQFALKLPFTPLAHRIYVDAASICDNIRAHRGNL